MNITQSPIEVEKINEIMQKVAAVCAEDEHYTVVATLLTMVVMATYPHLEGEELVKAVEQASEMLLMLSGDGTTHQAN